MIDFSTVRPTLVPNKAAAVIDMVYARIRRSRTILEVNESFCFALCIYELVASLNCDGGGRRLTLS